MNEHTRTNMTPIPFIDVAGQRKKLGKKIDDAVAKVLDHCQFILGPEVGALEARSDQLHDELESWVLRAAPEARNPDELRGLLRLASAGESVCDAARDMTWYVEHGEPLHPVVQMALEETEETSAETVVQPGSPAAGTVQKRQASLPVARS